MVNCPNSECTYRVRDDLCKELYAHCRYYAEYLKQNTEAKKSAEEHIRAYELNDIGLVVRLQQN